MLLTNILQSPEKDKNTTMNAYTQKVPRRDSRSTSIQPFNANI
jgi:hypothetical protein